MALARLRRWCPALQVWGLSATLGNLREAMEGRASSAALAGLLTALAANGPERDFGERSGDDIYLLYTGGTTGMPKGVMYDMGNFTRSFATQART